MFRIANLIILYIFGVSVSCLAEESNSPLSNENENQNQIVCNVSMDQLDSSFDAFKKSIQKEISTANSAQWFLGPPKADIYLREEKMTKLYKDIKQGKVTESFDDMCPEEYLNNKLKNLTLKSNNSTEAIIYTENKKSNIIAKNNCQDLNKLNCSYPVFKIYNDRLGQLSK